MKLTTPLVALALALAGSAASAATVGVLYDAGGNPIANGADLGPDLYSAVQADIQPTYTSSFDYVYNFALDSKTDLDVSANTYLGPTVDGIECANLPILERNKCIVIDLLTDRLHDKERQYQRQSNECLVRRCGL